MPLKIFRSGMIMKRNLLKSIQVGASLMILNLLMPVAQADLILQPTAITPTTLPATLSAEPMPSDASIERLVQVLHINTQIDTILAKQQQMNQAISQIPEITPATKPRGWGIKKWGEKKQYDVQQVLGKYSKIIAQGNDPEAQRQQILQAYKFAAKQHFTQAEVNAQLAFYDTPMGQQILAKQSLVTQDYLEKAAPVLIGELPNNIEKVLPNLQKDLEKIFN